MSLDVHVPWAPKDADDPAATEPLYDMFVAVTVLPVWVTVAFQALVIFWSPGYVHVTVQAVQGVAPVFATVMFAVKPPAHSLALVYVTWHAPAGALDDEDVLGVVGVVEGVVLGVIDGVDGVELDDDDVEDEDDEVPDPVGFPYTIPRPFVPTYTRP